MRTDFADFLDISALLLDAGWPWRNISSSAARCLSDGAVACACRVLAEDIATGMNISEAWMRMTSALPHSMVAPVAASLSMGDQLGVPIAHLLRAHADRLRAEHVFLAETRGAAASLKMLAPLLLCFLPSSMAIVFGPIILQLQSGAWIHF